MTGLTFTCCKWMNHRNGLCYIIILELVVRRFDVFDFFLFSSLFCSPGRFKWRQRHQIQPPPLNKMTTADDEGHLIWHRADCRNIFPPSGQLPCEHCRATSKKGWVRCTSKRNGPGWNRKTELQVLLISSYITPGIGCCVSAMSRCQLCSMMQFWTCMLEPREIFRTPPLVVISFYNQQMQIRNGQPINHSPAAEYWVAAASKHIMESIWIHPQTPRDVYMPIWDTLNSFLISFCTQAGWLAQQSFVPGAAGQLWHSLSCPPGKKGFKLNSGQQKVNPAVEFSFTLWISFKNHVS